MIKEFKTTFNGSDLTVKLPSDNVEAVLSFNDRPGLKDPEKRLRELLDDPIGCEKLVDIVKPGDKVALISAELLMNPQTWILAPIVVEALKGAGVRDEDITLVNAPGTHQTEEQQLLSPMVKKTFGPLHDKHKLVCHDCDKRPKLTYVGETSQGTPVFVNKAVMEADIKIGFNSLPPHHASGHCGGGKIIQPGVCGRASIGSMHRRIMCPDFREWEVGLPNTRNMVRKDIHESARLAGLDFCIDVVNNSRGEIIDIFAGDFEKEYEEGVNKVSSKVHGTQIDEKTDIAIYLSSGIGPFADFFTPKYLTGALTFPTLTCDMATEADGVSIIVQSAEEGWDTAGVLAPGYTDVYLYKHMTYTLKHMQMTSEELGWVLANNEYDLRDASLMWQARKTLDSKRTFLVSLYPKEMAIAIGFKYVTQRFEEALKKVFEEKGKDATITVITSASSYPILK